jgi:hypothetical protein
LWQPTRLMSDKELRRARRAVLAERSRELVQAIGAGDDASVERAVRDLSQSRRYLAPLALLIGAFTMLFQAVGVLVRNWRLALIEVLPAMWIWFAMLDLKAHFLRGMSFTLVYGTVLIPVLLGIALMTTASFYLNAVFAFAIAKPGSPQIGPAFTEARSHLRAIVPAGLITGLCLGLAAVVAPRLGRWWFAVSLSIVVAFMMWAYVMIPSRLVGLSSKTSPRRDRLWSSAIAGALGAAVCSPPYALGRLGIVLLGSHRLFVIGVVLITMGITLQSGATGAVKAIKMSAKLALGESTDNPGL